MKFNFLHTLAFICLLMFAGSHAHAQTTANEGIAPAITKEKVVGKWKNGDMEYTFNNDGTSIVSVDKRECRGTWELRGRTIVITPAKLLYKKDDPCSKGEAFRVISVNGKDLHVFNKLAKKEFHLAKQSRKETE